MNAVRAWGKGVLRAWGKGVRWPLVCLLVMVLATLAFTRRGPNDTAPPARAFYYWRTTLSLSAEERQALTELHVDRLYVRAFDVEWRNQAATSVGVLGVGTDHTLPPGIEVVPVVYVRNHVFNQLAEAQVAELATHVWRDVQRVTERLHVTPREVQLDCDWTDGTRARFFAFVEALRATAPRTLTWSATIRLHQIKFRERTGIPPVDRGMLMFYNMGRFSAEPGARAIFDAETARSYLAKLHEYPLPLDAALPIWSWTLHLRDNQVEGLMQSTDPAELTELDFLRELPEGRFEVTRTTFLNGTLLRVGDMLQGEVMGPAETRAAAELLAPELATVRTSASQNRTISLFDLSPKSVARHGTTNLERVFKSVH